MIMIELLNSIHSKSKNKIYARIQDILFKLKLILKLPEFTQIVQQKG